MRYGIISLSLTLTLFGCEHQPRTTAPGLDGQRPVADGAIACSAEMDRLACRAENKRATRADQRVL
jgi:hypothetical protein